ncbi:rhodanese-like domain-containing protein [Salisediminibacterium halotolerans]|uniref:rhodanese-like domain-containing protein n=1 Tax=Salisediminibacterium halotolerans TaxID=517425 RepID=UPI000EAFE31C|nr:rhodanese-like domain-containing protein [Salisediminibacterium halotolerans]RLJ77844.1 hypothetical protein BCL39_0308 [Actinophytocola xinjiangensis]RPE82809.1 hypothetical protein EDD67_2765 [Salisediminibacterium halotolerans]TWG36821.1 hypothetical protein BCL52_0307 [Salisediminibacterium halotolerans]GEL08727.1 hypothetical protein SHA02_21430 [Salisediminibacterium halotolerans]
MFWQVLILILLFSVIYYSMRYIPLKGVNQISASSLTEFTTGTDVKNKPLVIDVREFHEAKREPVRNSTNIPLPYLKRHYPRENKSPVLIVGKDSVEINLAARFLKKKGFCVAGCTQLTAGRSADCRTESKQQPVCNDAP